MHRVIVSIFQSGSEMVDRSLARKIFNFSRGKEKEKTDSSIVTYKLQSSVINDQKLITHDRTTFANLVCHNAIKLRRRRRNEWNEDSRSVLSRTMYNYNYSRVFFEKRHGSTTFSTLALLARATKISIARISKSRKRLCGGDSLYSGRQENFRDGLFAFPPKNSNETFPTGELFAKGLAAFTASLIRLYNHRKATRRRVHSHDSAFTSAGTLAVYYCRYRGEPLADTEDECSVVRSPSSIFFDRHQESSRILHPPLFVSIRFRC